MTWHYKLARGCFHAVAHVEQHQEEADDSGRCHTSITLAVMAHTTSSDDVSKEDGRFRRNMSKACESVFFYFFFFL